MMGKSSETTRTLVLTAHLSLSTLYSNARGVLSQRYHRLRGCRGRGMHRRAIQCNTCGKSFFPASLKFHIPQCIKKQQHLPIPCRYCDQEIKQMDMQIHLKHCTVAKQKMREEKRRRATKEKEHLRNRILKSSVDWPRSRTILSCQNVQQGRAET